MDSQHFSSQDSDVAGLLQELKDQSSCYFPNHSNSCHNQSVPEKELHTGVSDAMHCVETFHRPQQPSPSVHTDPKVYCSMPFSYNSPQPSTWNNTQIQPQTSQVPPQRSNYWSAGPQMYPPHVSSYGNVVQPGGPQQCMQSSQYQFSSHVTTPENISASSQMTCKTPASNCEKVGGADETHYSTVQSSQGRKWAVPTHHKSAVCCFASDRLCSNYATPLDEIRALNDRLSVLQQAPPVSAVQQETHYLQERLKVLECSTLGMRHNITVSSDLPQSNCGPPFHGAPHGEFITTPLQSPITTPQSVCANQYNQRPAQCGAPTHSVPQPSVQSVSICSDPEGYRSSTRAMVPDCNTAQHGSDVSGMEVCNTPTPLTTNEPDTLSQGLTHCIPQPNTCVEDLIEKQPRHSLTQFPNVNTCRVSTMNILPVHSSSSVSDGISPSEYSVTTPKRSPMATYTTMPENCQSPGSSLEPPFPQHTAATQRTSSFSVPIAEDIPPTAPMSFTQSPVPTGRSTLHYRQAPSIQPPVQFSSSPFTTLPSDQYVGSAHLTNGPVPSGLQGSRFYQPHSRHYIYPRSQTDGPAASYQYSRYQPAYPSGTAAVMPQPSTGYADHHLQPISSLSPNAIATQSGTIHTHPRFVDVEMCNGLGTADSSLYPPILPKVPGSPSMAKGLAGKSRRCQALDREARNERRRQQRLRKKQEEASQQSNDSSALSAFKLDDSVSHNAETVASPKRPRPRSRRPVIQSEGAGQSSSVLAEGATNGPTNAPQSPRDEDNCPSSPSKSKKRRNSVRPIHPKPPKKVRTKENDKLSAPGESDFHLSVDEMPKSSEPQLPIVKTATEKTDECETVKQLKVVRTRPPRPKKRKPLPTLIRKKKRSAFYGDESDSEPDVSGRLAGRGSEAKNNTTTSDCTVNDKKRRSERTAGDRKRYTVDLELNLTDDDSDTAANDDVATLNSENATGMVEDIDMKVVEYVLGRRVTKRVVKKLTKTVKTDDTSDGNTITGDTTQLSGILVNEEEEEEEEDVEEFYLKYRGYSYLHCEWRALDEIDDPRIRPKLRRFEMKQANAIQPEDDDVILFNPDYVEVERVLDMRVYRNGHLISGDKLPREVGRDTHVDPVELRKQRKRERERNRARALREAKAKSKVEAAYATEQTLGRSTPVSEEVIDSEATSRDATETIADDSLCDTRSGVLSRRESTSEQNDNDNEEGAESVDDSTSSKPILPQQPSATVHTSIRPNAPNPAHGILIENTLDADDKDDDEENDTKLPGSTPTTEALTKESDSDSDHRSGTHSPVSVTYYLVKWRSLPYEDATWELAQDVDPAKVKEFLKWRTPPKIVPLARDNDYKIIRPDASTWRPIEAEKVYKNDNKLRDYQLEGVNWLTYCWFHHRNCILADEMGLGKTVQSVAFLLEIEKTGVRGPFLIIVPLSTVANWQRELENWSDLNVVVYHGSSISRSMIQEYEIFYKRRPSDATVRHDVYKFHVLVTTFEILMTDIEFFGRIHWAATVIDEAHRLKNKKCKLGEGLRYLELDHRVLLTGTPLQNNVEELFGLLNFLEPERFNCSSTFVAEYGDLKTEEQVENLKALLKPMMLRRLKEDVEKSLAPKEETIVEVELTNIQKKYYRAIMERNFTFLCKGSTYANAPNLMNIMMELRKCCNHPFLIKGAEEAILDEMRSQQDPENPITEDLQTFHALVYASGKLVLIHKLLPKLRTNGHKVLIFSQMIRVLDILEDYLIHQRFQFERIDGRIHGPLRQEAIDRFTADPDKFVFLLCTKAGGLGINLTAADVVIIYDSDWNPQNDLQAQARCHRIGQQKMVKVYRLITRNTYEREMFDRASLKLGLDRAVLQSMGSKEARQAQMSKKEIEELLKKGAYGALMEDDKAGEEFCEEDIDKILQCRARVVQLEQGEKNSTFSKATFSMSDNRSDIELDDPNFWQKWAKKAGVDENAGTLKDLIMKTPRQRRQTSRYSSITINEPALVSPPSCDASEPEDSANAQSSGDDNVVSTSGGRGRFRRCRRQRRQHSRHLNMGDRTCRRTSQISLFAEAPQSGLESSRIEPLDRCDLFRVERCLLTWPWGHWEKGLSTISFKRQLEPVELGYFASAVLSYALRFMPPSADPRIRTTIITLTRPHVWNLSIAEVAKAVAKATSRASRGCRVFDTTDLEFAPPKDVSECTVRKIEVPSSVSDVLVESPSTTDAPTTPALCDTLEVTAINDSKVADHVELSLTNSTTKSDLPSFDAQPDTNETTKSCDVNTAIQLPSDSSLLTGDHGGLEHVTDLVETQSAVSEKPDEEEHFPNEASSTKCSPKTASFDPDILLPCDSFRKHMQRHSPRLINRVAFLLFLQCEVIGVEPSLEFASGRLTHEDFTDLAASLPPLEAIDSELPAPWWDSCCDKCLLLGILKHGWEKYTLIRIDTCLCFHGRAMARLKESVDTKLDLPILELASNDWTIASSLRHSELNTAEQSPMMSKSSGPNEEEETTRSKNDTKLPEQVEKLESQPSPKHSIPEFHLSPPSTPPPDEDKGEEQPPFIEEEGAVDEASVDSVLTALPFPPVADLNSRARKIVGFFLRIKNQLEFDTQKHLNIEDDEDSPGLPPNTRFMENRAIKWTRREEADFYRVVSSFGVEFTPLPPTETSMTSDAPTLVRRRYRWLNFRQLANITRKGDDALTEYFHSFYRMCQRVCKRTPTEFAGPASTAATTTTSGSSALGAEVPIEPISEERANRCLSRIDLLARIRNDVLPNPQLTERLKLCQRGSEIPSWWIPGKHDGELLRAAAKHGLAHTDLNILSDTEFSFHRIVTMIREKIARETAGTDTTTGLSSVPVIQSDCSETFVDDILSKQTNSHVLSEDACSVVESNDAAASSTTKTEAKETVDERGTKETKNISADICDTTTTNGSCNLAVSLASIVDTHVKKTGKPLPVSSTTHSDGDTTTTKEDTDRIESLPAIDEAVKPVTTLAEVLTTEWSLKYATSLATAWPKDRTIQHRLELVCQAIETNEWPMPRRYLPTPTMASVPVGDATRTLNDGKMFNFNPAYTAIRHPVITHSAFPISLSHPTKMQSAYGLIHAAANTSHLPNVSRPISLDSTTHPIPLTGPVLRNNASSASEKLLSKVSDGSPSETVQSLNSVSLNVPGEIGSPGAYSTAGIPSVSRIPAYEYRRRPRGSFGSAMSSSIPTSGPTTPSPRGRGRGRGRGSRGASRLLSSRAHLNLSSDRIDTDMLSTRNNSPLSPSSALELTSQSLPTPTREPVRRGRSSHDSGEHMLPPVLTPTPRGGGGRGRKRRMMEASGTSTEITSPRLTLHSKRERPDSSGSEMGINKTSKPSRGPSVPSTTSMADIWEVRVPVISLVDGSLIYGHKAPKRRALEQWLEANPNYMPYSIEAEDRNIYSRVAGARGQDTNNMETLAYKHYIYSLILNATAGLNQSPSLGLSPGVNKTLGLSSPQQQQLLQLQQQQQLLQVFGAAYARHPAYANLIASALGNWQSSSTAAPSTFPVSESVGPTSIADPTQQSPPISSTSMSTRTRTTVHLASSTAAHPSNSPTIPGEKSPSSDTSPTVTSWPEPNSQPTCSSPDVAPNTTPSSSSTTGTSHLGVDATISTVYKPNATNLAYMYNPLASVAAAYGQMMLSAAGSATGPDSSNANTNLSNQQAAFASLYASYMLSAKQTQQQQQQQQLKQQINAWDQQRQQQQQQQQIASLATAIATACAASTGGLDPTSLFSMFSGLGTRPAVTTTSNPSVTTADCSRATDNNLQPSTDRPPDLSSPVNLADRPHDSPPNSPSNDPKDSVSGGSQPSDNDQGHTVLDLSK